MPLKFNTMEYNCTCKVCGASFQSKTIRAVHCSPECKKITVKEEQRQKHIRRKAKLIEDPIEREKYLLRLDPNHMIDCPYCGKKYNPLKVNNYKYCSKECSAKAKRERELNRYRKNTNINETKTVRNLIKTKDEEIEMVQQRQEYEKLDPFYLRRGKITNRTGASVI